MAAFTTSIMAGITAAAPVVSAVSTAISGIKSIEAAETQKREIKKQQKIEATALKEQKTKQLTKRKEMIKAKRRQLLGAGDRFSIGQTGATGVLPEPSLAGTETLAGGALG